MQAALTSLMQGRLNHAETLVRSQLDREPNDVAALCLLGDLAARSGVYGEAERLFRLALSFMPRFTDAQFNLAKLLALRDALPEAIALLDDIIADRPERIEVATMRLALLGQLGDYDRAATGYSMLLDGVVDRPDLWTGFANLQATRGDVPASIAAFRRALTLDEGYGEAWWGLANLKTYRFSDVELSQLEALAVRNDLSLVHFALGKALQDRDQTERSFTHYAAANVSVRRTIHYDPSAISAEVDRSIKFFTPELFRRFAGAGNGAPDPIFIVGMPRSGSTLVEQILASHPLIEGTSELPYIPMLVHRLLGERWANRSLVYPDILNDLDAGRFHALGQTYLDAARAHRRLDRPFFIDKLPNNWRYLAFIKLILPNAKIIDARRDAMACLWSNYCQWFARGQEFSYDFADLAAYRRDYIRATAHIDAVLPGTIYKMDHEHLIANPEVEIPRLIDGLGLEFAPECLRFHATKRPVRTASAQQVRRPIDQKANEGWRKFEPWLGDLQQKL